MPDILTVYAESQPDKIAIIDDKGDENVFRWTYAEYEAAANKVGNALLSLGAGPRKKIIWCSSSPFRLQLRRMGSCHNACGCPDELAGSVEERSRKGLSR